MTLTGSSLAAYEELSECLHQCRPRPVRSISEFACAEIRVPEGKQRGQRFRYEVLPWTRLWHAAIDSGQWNRFALVGCVQGGKSWLGYAHPTLYHLFEGPGEPVGFAGPSIDEAKTKFRREVLPSIKAVRRFRKLLPVKGRGSRGGIGDEIEFRNGAVLKFFGSHGGDETRSSYTVRVIVATEVDKYDRPSETSRETSPVRQIENRTRSYDDEERIVYLECTASIPEGCIWQEYTKGTQTRIACPCPYCGEHVTPEREHLFGWQQAESVKQARRLAYFICPECGHRLTEADRRRMNERAKAVHRGQTIDRDGVIHGDPPETDTFGFRFNAFNNLRWSVGTIGAAEWEAARRVDEDAAEREMCQFNWAIPWSPPLLDTTPLDPKKIRRRTRRGLPRGLLPGDTEVLTLGVDIGKRIGWWLAIAWRSEGRCHVPDYGTFEVPSDDIVVERAIAAALKNFKERVEETGWLLPDGEIRIPEQVWIDTRYQPETIYTFCREAGERWRPLMGFGSTQQFRRRYQKPTKVGNVVVFVGDGYHMAWSRTHQLFIAQADADHWKGFVHERLIVPIGTSGADETPPGAMTFYDSADSNEHITLTKHVTAEEPREEYIPERGRIIRWVSKRRANHYLDASYIASAAGHFCGVRILPSQRPAAAAPPEPMRVPDNWPFRKRGDD